MDFFRPSTIDATLPRFYVLSPTDREGFEATLAALKRTLADVDVSFERAPWADLRSALGMFQEQVETARVESLGASPIGGTATDLVRREVPRGQLVRYVHGGHGSIQAFQDSTAAHVAGRRDAGLTDAHAKLLAAGKQADPGKQAAADYFAQFLPS